MAERNDGDRGEAGVFRVSASLVAIVASFIAVASLTTLVVSLSIGDADALAAVALAFGIVAFVAQLVIALAQFGSAERSQSESGRINTETRSLLAELRAVNEEMLRSQRDVVHRLIEQQLESLRSEATSPEEVDAADRLRANLLGLVPTRTLPPSSRPGRQEALVDAVREWIVSNSYETVDPTPTLNNPTPGGEMPTVIDIGGCLVVVDAQIDIGSKRDHIESNMWMHGDLGTARTLHDERKVEVVTLSIFESAPEDESRAWRSEDVVYAWPDVLSEVPSLLSTVR